MFFFESIMDIVEGNEPVDSRSNLGRSNSFSHPWERYASIYRYIVGQTGLFSLGMATGLGEGKLTLCNILLVRRG